MSIGRTEQCKVRIKDEKLSRIQAKLVFRGDRWMVIDGDGLKHSTNGTWLFVDRPFKLHDRLLIKAGNVVLKVVLPAAKAEVGSK